MAEPAGSLVEGLAPPPIRARWAAVLHAGLWRGLDDPLAALARARVDLVLWAPVALGCGIGAYFLWPSEPSMAILALAGALVLIGALVWLRGAEAAKFPAALVALAALGLLLAVWRAHAVAAPVLPFRYYGPVEGRIVEIDRSGRDVLRLTLDRPVLRAVRPVDRPARLRVALYGDLAGFEPMPGMRVMTTASLSPPAPPAEPGGWDFRRNAWFDGLGAVGYSRSPVMLVAPPDPGDWGLAGYRLRLRLSAAMQERIGGQAGAVAAALMTGDRSAIAEVTNQAMRDANLYHIVSISGLHMGMLAGFVFAALRYGLAAIGNLALIWPVKKIAAVTALMASALYLWIAGPQVATQRAFIMTAVMLTAVLFDRRAISLRTVALAALVLLVWQPESLTSPGFQMSFAATVGLILMARPWAKVAPRIPVWLRPGVMLVLTSLVAGAATAPIAAAQFNRMSHYGMIANLLAVPAVGVLVMPMGVIAAVLAPLGLAGPALWVMGLGTRWMLMVAETVAGMRGAVTAVVAPGPLVLPLLALGAAVAVLARGPMRVLGIVTVLIGGLLWTQVARPALLIAPEGELVGLMTPQGRALSKAAASFIGSSWLDADGDVTAPDVAAARAGFDGPRTAREGQWQGRALVHLTGKGAETRLGAACHDGALVVLSTDAPKGFKGDCDLWDRRRLHGTGAVALWPDGHIVSAHDLAGDRLWTGRPRARAFDQ